MGNIDRVPSGGDCGSPDRRQFLAASAGLVGLAAIGGISGCASSKANSVVGGRMIEDEVSCGGNLARGVSGILDEADYIKTAESLDEICECSGEYDFVFVDSVKEMLTPDQLAQARLAEEVEKENDAVVAELKGKMPSVESVEALGEASKDAYAAYLGEKTSAKKYQEATETAFRAAAKMKLFEIRMEEIKETMRAYLAVASRYMRFTSESNDFYRLRKCKLVDLRRKVADTVSMFASLTVSHFYLKNSLPPSSFLLEESPVDVQL